MIYVFVYVLAVLLRLASVLAQHQCPAQIFNETGLGQGETYFKVASSWESCCDLCSADVSCRAWTFDEVYHAKKSGPCTNGQPCCILRSTSPSVYKHNRTGKVAGVMPARPTPTPSPVPAGSQKNIVFITTDDQDLMSGSMRALPHTARLLGKGGANLTQFRVNTPICCPSRSTMLTGRFNHNNRNRAYVPRSGCMYMNSSRAANPEFWHNGFVRRLHDEHGYTTGLFGKTLNTWQSYGCDDRSGMPPGVDRQLVMCTHTFFNCSWVNDSVKVWTGDAPEDYTTSVMGNASLQWIESVLKQGDTHPPFFAWIGPHAPHLPATPAPWYAQHPIGQLRAPRGDPWYNYSGADHHRLVAEQPVLSAADAQGIDAEYAKRMRSLLSVDDMVLALFETLQKYGEWDRTYVAFSSDHGYSLGQFRLPSHKMQVYDNNLRVPFFIRGPGIPAGQQVSNLTQFADLAPTLLQLGGAQPRRSDMDGRSFAPLIMPSLPPPAEPWKTVHLTTYQSIYPNHCTPGPKRDRKLGPGFKPDSKPDSANHHHHHHQQQQHHHYQLEADGGKCGRHAEDDATNTHRSIRIINATHNLLFAEFTDVSVPGNWDFPEAGIQFRELYEMDSDPFQLRNVWNATPTAVQASLRAELAAYFHCKGADCP